MSFWPRHIVSEAHTLGYLYGLGLSVLYRKRRVTIRLFRVSGHLEYFVSPVVVTAKDMAGLFKTAQLEYRLTGLAVLGPIGGSNRLLSPPLASVDVCIIV